MRPSINLGYGVANVQPLVQNKFKRGLNSISRQSFIFYYLMTTVNRSDTVKISAAVPPDWSAAARTGLRTLCPGAGAE